MYIMAESKSQRRNTELILANRDCETSKRKGIFVSVYARKAYGWKRGIVPFILMLGTRCRKVAHLMPWPLYPEGNGSSTTEYEAEWAAGQSGHFGEKKKSLALPGIE